MIEVQNLTKSYGPIAAVRDVSFHVAQGEIVGFLGPNAAGKSTTMRVLAGYMPATSGTARIAGFDVATDPIEVKRRVGYLPENVPLYPEMTVRGFLRYAASVKAVARDRIGAEIDRVLEHCGLADMGRRTIRNLSKGYRQRVGLAQALLNSPPVLILDEPTVGLDPRQIIEIRNMIVSLAAQHTILLSSHILPEVAMVCGRVLIIHQGRLVAEESMASLAGAGAGMIIEVEATGDETAVLEALRAITGVEDAKREGADRYVVRARPGADPRVPIGRALVSGGIGLRALTTRQRTLEDVFVESITKEAGAAHASDARRESA